MFIFSQTQFTNLELPTNYINHSLPLTTTMEEEKKTEDADANMIAADSTKPASASTPTPVVDIQNLTFHYDPSRSPNIVGLNCIIESNSRIILAGANGAGKSTLLRVLTGQIFMGMRSDVFVINGMDRASDITGWCTWAGRGRGDTLASRAFVLTRLSSTSFLIIFLPPTSLRMGRYNIYPPDFIVRKCVIRPRSIPPPSFPRAHIVLFP